MLHSKKWICGCTDEKKVNELSGRLGVSPLLAMALVNRGIDNAEKARNFIYTDMDDLGDPFQLPDMRKAVERIEEAIERGQKICIYGDYDVDGITSVAVMIKVLSCMGADAFYYIPGRMDEGYGLNKPALDEIHDKGAALLITVDCGIASHEEVEYGNSLGMDIIVTDHHQCPDELPPALAVINPKREDSRFSFRELAGVGVAYNLCQALEGHSGKDCQIHSLMDMVALGTVADLVPLTGDNRVIVKEGLDVLKSTRSKGLKALIEVSGLDINEINTWHLAFMLAPRINAAGRLCSARKGVELLLTDDYSLAVDIARVLDENNRERQTIEKNILHQVVAAVKQEKGKNILVAASEEWHPGVVGIVASRITEKYNKPSVVFCIEEGEARGSARSIPGLDIYALLSQCKHYYNRFGGHKQAAGLALDVEKLEGFTREIDRIAGEFMRDLETRPVIRVEGDLTDFQVTSEDVEHLGFLQPFGLGNPEPLFVKRGVKVIEARKVGQNKSHLKLVLQSKEGNTDAILFGWGERPVPVAGMNADIVFVPAMNTWMGKNVLQFNIKDMKKIEENVEFLTQYYASLNRLIEKENKEGREGDASLLKEFEQKRTDDRFDYISRLFRSSTGNILIANGFRETSTLISLLSLHDNARICFGELKSYSEGKNYLVINPTIFDNMEKCKGKLLVSRGSALPGQMRRMQKIGGVPKILLTDGSNGRADNEFEALLPHREVFEQVYLFISENKRVNFYHCLYEMRRRGHMPITVIRAIDTLRYCGLIGTESCYLVLQPAPREKADIQKAQPYSSLKEFIVVAAEWSDTVKKYSVDI